MTIHSIDRFMASLPDWAILEGCFGFTFIKPTDIDGCVERKGVVLFLEHKGMGVDIKTGQRILFETLARQGNTVIVYWTGEALDDVVAMRIYHPGDLSPKTQDATLADLRRAASDWYSAANAR